MNQFVDNLIHIPAGGKASDLWLWVGRTWPIWAVLIALAAVGLGSWWSYRPTRSGALSPPVKGGPAGRGLPRSRRWTMAGLRLAALLLIVLVLAEPLVGYRRALDVKPVLIVMLDDSQSMTLRDQRKGVAPSFHNTGKGKQGDLPLFGPSDAITGDGNPTRAELLKAIWRNKELDLQSRLGEDYELRFYRFGKGVNTLGANSGADAVGKETFQDSQTDLGGALDRAVRDLRGSAAAGIVVFTDGNHNAGPVKPAAAAEQAAKWSIPIYPVGLGLAKARDLQIASFLSSDVLIVNDPAQIDGALVHSGYGGGESAGNLSSVFVELRQGNEVVARKQVKLTSEQGEEWFQLSFTPRTKGIFDYTLSVETQPDELIGENNSKLKRIRVSDDPIKVLVVEEAPRWDFRFLKGAMTRDKRFALKVWVREADGAMLARGGMPEYLARFPDKREDLFKYDVIVLGDVPAKAFTKDQLHMLENYVTEGGGLMFAAGMQYNPATYAGSELEPLLPVAIEGSGASNRGSAGGGAPGADPSSAAGADALLDLFKPLVQPFQAEITPEGQDSPVCRLAESGGSELPYLANAAAWRRLPAFYWFYPTSGLRSKAARSLVEIVGTPVLDGHKTPLIAYQQHGRGLTLYLGTNSTWRWRDIVGGRHFDRFWGQAIKFLGETHRRGGSPRVRVEVASDSFAVGNPITVTATVLDRSYQPSRAAAQIARVTVVDKDGKLISGAGPADTPPITLRKTPNEAGRYHGEFFPAAAGDYVITVQAEEEEGDAETPGRGDAGMRRTRAREREGARARILPRTLCR